MGNGAVLWQREDHTQAKHDLLRGFFDKWVSVHSGYFARQGTGLVRIYDGFAGPGVYEGGEPGSPLILMRALGAHPHMAERWRAVRYDFQFVEKHAGRAASLQAQLAQLDAEFRAGVPGWAERVRWTVTRGNYEEHVPGQVAEPSALFLFIDPFGYSHAPMTLTQDLVQQPKSDTLIFLPLSFVNRFVERDGQQRALDRFFGSPAWRDVPDGEARPAALLELFQAQLRSVGLKWTLPFRLRPSDGRNAYWIVGASGHLDGFASIKAGFWAVDKVHGQGYAAPRPVAEGQVSLDLGDVDAQGPDTRELLDLLRSSFGTREFSVEDAKAVTARSRFLVDGHLKDATLAPAEKCGKLVVRRPVGVRRFKDGQGITMRFAS
jgi:three-Cys-motif partner protein